jgi:glycosyltransferase involved in cell wall biosynthesis
VIATDVGCIPEMIKAGNVEAGLILPLSPQRTIDVDKLTSLLLRYMINDKLFQLHSKNASQVFTSLFDISKIKSATLAMYNFLLT